MYFIVVLLYGALSVVKWRHTNVCLFVCSIVWLIDWFIYLFNYSLNNFCGNAKTPSTSVFPSLLKMQITHAVNVSNPSSSSIQLFNTFSSLSLRSCSAYSTIAFTLHSSFVICHMQPLSLYFHSLFITHLHDYWKAAQNSSAYIGKIRLNKRNEKSVQRDANIACWL